MKQETIWWQWHQLEHSQIICTLLQTDNHASTSSQKKQKNMKQLIINKDIKKQLDIQSNCLPF